MHLNHFNCCCGTMVTKAHFFFLGECFFEKLFCYTKAPDKNNSALGNNYRCEKMQARVYFYFHKKNAAFSLDMVLNFTLVLNV